MEDAPHEEGAADLADDELAAVVAAVEALVSEDAEALSAMGAYENGSDPYLFTRDWREWDEVHLKTPPGDPRSWNISVVRTVRGTCDVDIEMWTEEEGRSDLTLQVELTRASDGSLRTTFENLHVL
jgi:hypothetical protein